MWGGGWRGWALDQLLGMELRGKQLGIVGRGRVGRAGGARGPAVGLSAVSDGAPSHAERAGRSVTHSARSRHRHVTIHSIA